jgi:nitroimidazol reductase NimA-like FMN-containing flavoprotein (pyridoxamine 5'-phosphate oxidase superfamily)
VTADAPPPPIDRLAPRSNTKVLRPEECLALLRKTSVGRLAFVVDGWPVVLPINYVVDGQDVVFRTDPGTKLSAIRCAPQVALEIDAVQVPRRSGWSVLLHGMAAEVIDRDEIERLRVLRLTPWEQGDKRAWVRVRTVQLTGRRLPAGWHYPDPLP